MIKVLTTIKAMIAYHKIPHSTLVVTYLKYSKSVKN